MKQYIGTNVFLRRTFGCKVYKLALSASVSCPNRDGTKGTGGCIFCSAGGSGNFASSCYLPVSEQILQAKEILGDKGAGLKYVAYFQSFTGTYGDIPRLERMYNEAADHPDVVGLSIATRPDCLGDGAMAMLKKLSEKTALWVELGLQTMHDKTANLINRCYDLSEYDSAIEKLRGINAHVITHVILGLPGESRADMMETVRYAGEKSDGIKLQLLHVLYNTALSEMYRRGEFEVMSLDEYCETVADAIELLPDNVVIHRITGDGDKRELIAPLWSGDKKRVLNELNRELSRRGITHCKE